MTSLYQCFTSFVNCIGGKNYPPIHSPYFLYNLPSPISVFQSMYDYNLAKLDNYLLSIDLKTCVKYIYLTLLMRHKAFKKIYVNIETTAKNFGIEPRTLRSYFLDLENISLITRHYNSHTEDAAKKGNKVYIELTPPASLFLRSLIIFKAKFISLDHLKGNGSILLQDISGVHEDERLYTKKCLLDYTEKNASFIDDLYEGDYIEFSATLQEYEDEKARNRWLLLNPQNFRKV